MLTLVGTFALLGGAAYAAEEIGTYTTPRGDEVAQFQMEAKVIDIAEEGRPLVITVEDTATGETYTMPGGHMLEDKGISQGDTMDITYTETPDDHPRFAGEIDILANSINGEEIERKGPRGGGHRGEGFGEGECLHD